MNLLWGILPTRARLHKILPLPYASPDYHLCGPDSTPVPKTLQHALGDCAANQGLPSNLLRLLQIYQPGAEQCQLMTLDLELDPELELPMTWTVGSLLFSLWRHRTESRVNLAKTRSELEAKCRLLREGRSSIN